MHNCKETAQQFIAKVIQQSINEEMKAPAHNSVQAAFLSFYPDSDPEATSYQLIVNSVEAESQKIARKTAADTEKWQLVGQMDLFGTNEFKVPKGFIPQSIAATDAFMTEKARAETEAANVMTREAQKQSKKAHEITEWAFEVRRLRESVEHAGMNPEETSIENAIKQAEAVRTSRQALVSA